MNDTSLYDHNCHITAQSTPTHNTENWEFFHDANFVITCSTRDWSCHDANIVITDHTNTKNWVIMMPTLSSLVALEIPPVPPVMTKLASWHLLGLKWKCSRKGNLIISGQFNKKSHCTDKTKLGLIDNGGFRPVRWHIFYWNDPHWAIFIIFLCHGDITSCRFRGNQSRHQPNPVRGNLACIAHYLSSPSSHAKHAPHTNKLWGLGGAKSHEKR